MARLTIALGVILFVLGLVAYFLLTGDTKSPTALIPSAFGVVFLVLGGVALKPRALKHAMHAAMVVALLGILGTSRGLMQLPTLISNADELERPSAVGVQSSMAALCIVFLILGIASFVSARRSGGAAGS